jgi:hypothetical protein
MGSASQCPSISAKEPMTVGSNEELLEQSISLLSTLPLSTEFYFLFLFGFYSSSSALLFSLISEPFSCVRDIDIGRR